MKTTIMIQMIKQVAAASALLLLASCGKDEHEPEPAPTLKISPAAQTISFSAADTKSYTFTVTTDQPQWKAVSDQTWCEVETDAEAGTFTVTAQPNYETTEAAPATITVTAGKAAPLTITATQAGARYEVHVVGVTLHTQACYWKDGELVQFKGPATSISMCIADNSVYIGGYYGNNSCYWKDGELTLLEQPNGATNSQCNAIAVSDGRVFGVGHANNGNNDYFCYWSDDKLSKSFANGAMESYGSDIAVCDGTIYMLGNVKDSDGSSAWYMKADDPATVMLQPRPGYIRAVGNAIAVSEGKVYVAGYCEDESFDRTAGYWLDGEFVPLFESASAGDTWADAIVVENGTVHIAGMLIADDGWRAFYWNNKQGHTLLPVPVGAEEGGEPREMEVIGGKVYISGSYFLNKVITPCYWIDGERVDLPNPNGDEAVTCAIAVMIK